MSPDGLTTKDENATFRYSPGPAGTIAFSPPLQWRGAGPIPPKVPSGTTAPPSKPIRRIRGNFQGSGQPLSPFELIIEDFSQHKLRWA